MAPPRTAILIAERMEMVDGRGPKCEGDEVAMTVWLLNSRSKTQLNDRNEQNVIL